MRKILHRQIKFFFGCSIFVLRAFLMWLSKMTEEEIYEGCRRGDSSSRQQLYILYSGRMMAIGMRYLADREVAEDVLHDVFLRIFTSFDKFVYRGNGSLWAWLSRVMVNASLEYLRREHHSDELQIETLKDDIADDDADVERVPQEVLMKFIGELPAGYRTVLNLFVFEGKSHKEIAAMLGINEKSSSSQFFRAKTLLTKKINNYLELNGGI